MPEDYVNCRDSYIKKGVSERVAKARCAAWFYKKHGYTVNEAHKKGEASAENPMPPELISEDTKDLDWELVELILTDLDKLQATVEQKETEAIFDILGMNIDMLEELGIVEITATKVGAGAYTGMGLHVTWSKPALKKAEKSWKLTRASVNHTEKEYGRVLSSFLNDEDELRMVVKVDDELKEWLKVAGYLIGVSIEATNVKINAKKLEITSAIGSGVTFVFPPHVPACKQEEGCGIVGSEAEAVRYEPPEAGKLPDRGKSILNDVYSKCRSTQYKEDTPENKERCSKIAWHAVKQAGYTQKKETGEWSGGSEGPFDVEKLFDDAFGAYMEEVDGAKLSYQQRKELPESAFCGPDRSFPAQDAAHVRNGLARLSQANISPATRSKIHSCLVSRAKKYGIEVSKSEEMPTNDNEAKASSNEGAKMTETAEASAPAPVEEKKTVCAKLHEKMVSERDARITELEKQLEATKATILSFENEKRGTLLEKLKNEGVDPEPYKAEPIPMIEKIIAVATAVKKKEEETPVEKSGVTVVATEQTTDPSGKALTKEEPAKVPEKDEQLENSWRRAEEKGYKRPIKK